MIDFTDGDFLQDPYPTLNRVREETPLFSKVDEDGTVRWFLTRYDDVFKALRDRRLGRVPEPVMTRAEVGLPPLRPEWKPYYDLERWSLLMLEPPDHRRLRQPVFRAFTPKRIEGLRPDITRLAERLLSNPASAGTFDLLGDFARPFSVGVIAGLLGVPSEAERLFLDWSHRIVKMYELHTTEEQAAAAVRASEEFDRWCRELIEAKREDPGDDLVTALCMPDDEGDALSDDEIVSTIVLLLNAGHEATVNALGNGTVALLSTEGAWDALSDGVVEPAVVVEEMIRYDPPLQLFERWVLADDVSYGGRSFSRGEKIALLFGSANRDPRHFPSPDDFIVGRGDASHVTFGGGIHSCIGAPLARMELSIAITQMVETMPALHLAAAPVRDEAFVIHGYGAVQLEA